MGKDEVIKLEILLSAEKLFQQFGLKKTTMDEIAKSCGKAKSSLYHYYKSKDEVFDAVFEYETHELRKLVQKAVNQKTSLKAKLETYMLSYYKNILSMLNLYRIVKHEMMEGNTLTKYFQKIVNYEKEYIGRLIKEYVQKGELSDYDQETTEILSEMLVVGFMGIVRYSIETDDAFDYKKLEKTAAVIVRRLF